MAKKKMTAKQAKYFSKGHGKVSKGGKVATKKQAKMPMTNKSMTKKAATSKKKMPMVNGKPAWLSKKNKKRK